MDEIWASLVRVFISSANAALAFITLFVTVFFILGILAVMNMVIEYIKKKCS